LLVSVTSSTFRQRHTTPSLTRHQFEMADADSRRTTRANSSSSTGHSAFRDFPDPWAEPFRALFEERKPFGLVD
jgi:hypothetical protein